MLVFVVMTVAVTIPTIQQNEQHNEEETRTSPTYWERKILHQPFFSEIEYLSFSLSFSAVFFVCIYQVHYGILFSTVRSCIRSLRQHFTFFSYFARAPIHFKSCHTSGHTLNCQYSACTIRLINIFSIHSFIRPWYASCDADADCCLRILQLFNRTTVHVPFRMHSTRFKLKIVPLNVCIVHTLYKLTWSGTIVAS